VIVAIPGPSVLFTISRALTLGRRAALLTVVGNAVGVSAQVVAVAFGIGAVVERSVVAFTIVKYLGAAYIVYLGVQAVRHRRAFTDGLAQRAAPVTPLRAMRDGAIVGATNPKTIVVFVAFMPGFTDPAAGICSGSCCCWDWYFPSLRCSWTVCGHWRPAPPGSGWPGLHADWLPSAEPVDSS